MPSLKSRIDNFIVRFTDLIVDNPYRFLGVSLIVFAAAIIKIPSIVLDTSTEGYLHENDPALLAYEKFRGQFGRDDMIIVAVSPPNIFDIDFLKKLQGLHHAIERELPYLDEVTSLINARHTYGDNDTLYVEDLLKDLPQNNIDMQRLKDIVAANPLYKNLLVSGTLNVATLLIKTDPSRNTGQSESNVLAGFDDTPAKSTQNKPARDADEEIVNALYRVTERFQARNFPISVAGTPVMIETLKNAMRHDMRKFTAAALLVIAIILFLLFRRASGVALPLVTIIVSTLTTIGIMAWSGAAIKLPTQILPSFLLTVGVAASIHLLSVFYRTFYSNNNKTEAIREALRHCSLPIAMTSVTTAIGLWSFSFAEVAPIADLGIYAGLGVMLSLYYTLVLLPALLVLLPIRTKNLQARLTREKRMDIILLALVKFSIKHSKCIVTSCAIIVAAALVSVIHLSFYHNPLTWLPENADIRNSTSSIDRSMHGSNTVEVVIDTKRPNGLYEPAVLNRIHDMQRYLMGNELQDVKTGKTVAITDILKETHQALNENSKLFYRIPESREAIAQELLLFENSGSDDLEELTDSQFSKARLTVKIPWADAETNSSFAAAVEKKLAGIFAKDATVTVTGMIPLMGRTMFAAINSTKTSYFIAFTMIAIVMIILLGGIRLGLLSMIPNLLPIVTTLGYMGYTHLPLDMFSMLIGSIAIGIVVDDTIHFLHVYKRNLRATNNAAKAISDTMLFSGRAILITSIVLSSGFFIFTAATLNNLHFFGILTGITIVVALIADLVLLPAILFMLHNKQKPIPATLRTAEDDA